MNRKLIAYLDAVEGYINSITRAILNEEGMYPVAMYDEESSWMRLIPLPAPQTAGTTSQKEAHARDEAKKIVEDMKSWNPHLDYDTFGTLPFRFESVT